MLQGAVGVRDGDERQEQDAGREQRTRAATSISPEAIRAPDRGRGQVEGDGLAGDEVVGGERRELR